MDSGRRVCRFCLKNENTDIKLYNIFEYNVPNLSEKIHHCLLLQVTKDDGLPVNACLNCIESINCFFTFKEMCYNSHHILNNRINKFENDKGDTSSECDYTHRDVSTGDVNSLQDFEAFENMQDEKSKTKIYKIDDGIREIIGENVYSCDVCKTNFHSFIEYFDHQETHNGQPVFECDKCNKVFYERTLLVEHDLRHKIPCDICKLEVLPKSMSAHLLIHTDMHKCQQCGMRHTSKASLEKHINARHNGIKGFVCHICGKQSSCQSSMNRHMGYHSTERPYKCKYCDFCAKSLNIVQVHTSRKHFAEKCVCEICAKIFKSQPSLIQHMKRIHTTRKHICDICGKAFIERYNLNRHVKKHVGQRLHECKICHKEFFTVRKLKEHMHTHRQGCVNCPKCGKEFFYKKYFNKHVLKCNDVYIKTGIQDFTYS